MKGLWLLPCYDRPDSLKRFFRAYKDMKSTTAGMVITQPKHVDAIISNLPLKWRVTSFTPTKDEPVESIGAVIRDWMSKNPWQHFEWLGLMCDDQLPVTEEWDVKTLVCLNGKNFVTTDDGMQPWRFVGALAWSVPLLKAVGYIFPKGLYHMYADDIWEQIGQATGTWTKNLDVLVRHIHWSFTTGVMDDSAKHSESFFKPDYEYYVNWLKTEFPETIKRVRGFLESGTGV